MSKTTWFQITLLGVWGVSAMTALSVSFWLTQADWVHAFKSDANSIQVQHIAAESPQDARQFRDEMLVLKQSVARLDRQNKILMSRLEIIEDEAGEFTAAIPSSPVSNDLEVGEARSQQMPAVLNNTLNQHNKVQSSDRVFTRVDPYPLKLQGTDRAPTDAEISKALKGQ